MLQVIKNTSRSLRIALVLSVIAMGFAANAYAIPWNDSDSSDVSVGKVGVALTDGKGTQTYSGTDLYGSSIVKNSDGSYTATYRIGIVNTGNINLRVGLLAGAYAGNGIRVTSYDAKAIGNAPPVSPSFNAPPTSGGAGAFGTGKGSQPAPMGSGTSYGSATRYVFGNYADGQQPHLAPGQTYFYDIILNATTDDTATAQSLDCNRGNDNSSGSYRTGFTLFLNGVAGDDSMQWGVGFTGYSCADGTTAAAAPLQSEKVETPPQAQNDMPAATSPIPTAPPATIPAPANAQASLARGGNAGDVPSAVLSDKSEQNNDQAAQGTQALQSTQPESSASEPLATHNSDSKPTAQELPSNALQNTLANKTPAKESAPFVSTKNVDRYNSIVAMPSKSSHVMDLSKARGSAVIAVPKSVSHSSSHNVEYVFAGFLAACAAAALVSAKISRGENVSVKKTPAGRAPSIELQPVVSTLYNARLYNGEVKFVDVYALHDQSREPELVGAVSAVLPSTSSISSSAHAPLPRRAYEFDQTFSERQSLPARIWNELTKRKTKEHVNMEN